MSSSRAGSVETYLSFLFGVPIGLVLGFVHCPPPVVFILNLLCLIPLTTFLSGAAEKLSIELGSLAGGLCRGVFGNAGDLMVCLNAAAPLPL